jgi:hypothetical protein
MEASSNKGGLAPIDIKKLVNQIFARRGAPDVKNFAKEFSDGSKSLRNENNSLDLKCKVLTQPYSSFPGTVQHPV